MKDEKLVGGVDFFFFFLGLVDKDQRKDPHMLVIRELKNPPGLICNLIHPEFLFVMILPQVHLRKPCYDFYFL